MEIAIKIAQLLASLSLLVLIHELGHFMFARLFKCRVEKFYLFFNPWFSIWKKKIGDTEYGIGWLPLGGYCKISGMVDESMDSDQLSQEPQPYEYRSKPAWQRFFIITGGVLMNFVLALVIYIGITFAWGDSYIKTSDVTDGFAFSTEVKELGFRDGDKIISVDDQESENSLRVQVDILLADKREVKVERDGMRISIDVPEEKVKLFNEPGAVIPRLPFTIGELEKGGTAEKAGLKPGDSLVGADSVEMKYLDQYKEYFAEHKNDTVNLDISRAGNIMTIPVVISATGVIGVSLDSDISKFYKLSTQTYTLWQSVPKGIDRGFTKLGEYWKQLKLIFSPKTEVYKSVGGFITMGKIFPGQWDWMSFWNITAFLSIMLAVINILPIPALDGGHMVFILYEMITRRTPSQKFMENAQMVGFFMLIALLLYANGSDIIRLFT